MSDEFRKDFSDKVAETVKPESQKTTTEKVTESVTNTLDNAAGKLQSDESKNPLQRTADDTHDAKNDVNSYLESAKKEGAKIIESAQNLMHQAAEYIHDQTGTHNANEATTTTTTQVPK